MKIRYLSILSLICAAAIQASAEDLTLLVDTRVGTAPSVTATAGMFGKNTEELGQMIPAVLEPNGMNFWTAQTQDTELKCKAPYYYNQIEIQGFRNSHWIVGGCTQDYGSMTLMTIVLEKLSGQILPQDRASVFSHDDEIARPDYYAVKLARYNIFAEMTGRSRSGFFRFTYPIDKEPFVVVNPNSDEGQGFVEIDTLSNEIRGYNPIHRIYQGKGESAGYSGYFVIKFDCGFDDFGTARNVQEDPKTMHMFAEYGATQAKDAQLVAAFVKLKLPESRIAKVKVGVSFTSVDDARKNLEAEIPHWDFDKTKAELNEIWNKHLGRIEIPEEANTQEEANRLHELRQTFYGAFYRTSFLPHDISNVDGTYPRFAGGGSVMQLPDGVSAYYDDYSMWDTYRALHPLVTLLQPHKSGEMMQSLVLKAEQGGWLPIFPCWNSSTAAMIGDPCSTALADAMVKGVKNFDWQKAYKYMRKNAFESPATYEEYCDGKGRRALDSYLKYGYIPLDDQGNEAFHKMEQVSRTLEYAFDDFAVSQAANILNQTEDYKTLTKRSKNYKNVFDPRTGYVQGRDANGKFLSEDAFGFRKFITEGAPCHYSWYVPHDVEGLIKTMGGKNKYVAKLDSMFTQQRYWHGNEPCHQVAFMFNYANKPKLTQKWVRHIVDTEYLNEPGGIPGNSDAGQMDAWYVFAAMGLYPVCPAKPEYAISSPIFPKIILHLENGKDFTIESKNYKKENIFISNSSLNGQKLKNCFLSHDAIMSGGSITHSMSNK